MKPGQPRRFRRGNLAVVEPQRPATLDFPDILAVWNEPPTTKEPRVVEHLKRDDIVIVVDIRNIDQHVQYSKVFSARRGTLGWANSKFLRRVQR